MPSPTASLNFTGLGVTMNRTAVRLAASLLAAGITIFELVGIEWLSERAGFAYDSAVVLPRITVTPAGPQGPDDRDGTWTESVDASATVQPRAASQARN
jgi:hypothetical protein